MSPLRILRAHRGVAGLLALLTLTAATLLAGLPRIVADSFDRAVRRAVQENPAEPADLTVALEPESSADLLTDTDRLAEQHDRLHAGLPGPLRAIVATGAAAQAAGASYAARTRRMPLADRIGAEDHALQFLNLAWVAGAGGRVRYVAGSPPGPPTTAQPVPGYGGLGDVPLIEVALSHAGAAAMNLSVGSLLLLGDVEPRLARVTGLFEPVRPADPFWRHHRDLLRASIRLTTAGDEQHLTGLVHHAALARLGGPTDLRYEWTLPVDSGAITARDAAAIAEAVDRYRDRLRRQAALPNGVARFELHTGLDTGLGRFLERQRVAVVLGWLVIGGLGLVACGAVTLAVRLLCDRLRPAPAPAWHRSAVRRSRSSPNGQRNGEHPGAERPGTDQRVGGSRLAVARVAAGAGAAVALVCVPAALLGYGLGSLVPGPAVPPAHLAPSLLALGAAVTAAGLTAAAHRAPARGPSGDAPARRLSRRRLATEVAVVVLALAAAYLLRVRGLPAAGAGARDGDAGLFLVLAPVPLAVAAGLVTVRLSPFALRLPAWLAARRRSAVPFLGLALATRAGDVCRLPALVLLPALAVAVYGVVAADALESAQSVAAWRATGAAARVERLPGPAEPVLSRLREVPDVRAVVPALKGTGRLGARGQSVTVVAVDLAAYRRLVAGSPLTVPAPPADVPGTALPALVTRDLTVYSRFEVGWYRRIEVVPTGVIDGGLPGLAPEEGSLVVVPFQALPRAGLGGLANVLLVDGDDPDPAELRAAAGGPDASVVTVHGEAERLAAAPMATALRTVLWTAAAAVTGCAVLAVLLAPAARAGLRSRTLATLRVLGLSAGQACRVTAFEVAAVAACPILAGTLLGLTLPVLLGPGVDLAVFAGTPGDYGLPFGLVAPILLAAGLIAAAALGGGLLHAGPGRRRIGDRLPGEGG
ncbi:hypothetical protein GCM10010106_10710 [Thermopolyspora flexuosa]|uniref:FtsX-like permease family protein n=1 Tax=Thermopolyspora flexuosa TaxID=103836 RepID=A0A543J0H3_9ACTN|nr:hypothetical protein [Thermopolyspora flexuosa]TQM76322.1 hypothetical protein FHX40_3055 [Thermopolyspora flexuosa]GGM66502.1 hypothetical protein GCM10010106_10710 [Thermopolyspora flexuosa]